jgi:D-beta-D-heptose 7-phosphate kinase/D-beta-D-heptose 1-phosphate adenosyltransferase
MKIVIEYGREIVKLIKIWTNGCFDILHRGHLELFKYAKNLGNKLMVGVDSDKKVMKDKGPNRPINNLQDRIEMLKSIRYIDKVVYFDSIEELEHLIKRYSPDIIVVGADWKGKRIIGEVYSKEVRFFDRIEQYSTTKILNYANCSRNQTFI